jgi:hypothetical protein
MGWGSMGALQGLGEGLMTNAKRAAEDQADESSVRRREESSKRLLQAEDQSYEGRSRIDEAREQRLARFQADIQAQAAEVQHGRNKELVTHEGEVQRGINAETQGAETSRHQATLAHDAEQGDAQRQNNLEVAALQSSGRGGSRSAAEVEASERFEPRTSTMTTTGANGLPMESQVSTIYDKETRRTYIQQGNRFMPQGVEPSSIRPASAAAIDMLLKGEVTATDFLEQFNYLPARYVETLSSQRSR